ncbi:hypothetical protein K9M79_01955 [Candidatus Woesearchaeota archaeon]|nr:hypothetical protein [Candidatus Woesearchaeota archaeon]
MLITVKDGIILTLNPRFYDLDSIITALSELSSNFRTRMESESGYKSTVSQKYIKIFLTTKNHHSNINSVKNRNRIKIFLTRALNDKNNSTS